MKMKDHIFPGDVIALGDVHASWDLYSNFLKWVEGSKAVIVILGDLIDRGGQDMEVLNATRDRLEDPEKFGLASFHVLMGNHERMFIDSFTSGPFDSSAWAEWIANGGNRLQSADMKKEHLEWIKNLPVYMTIGDTVFVHGALPPGHDPYELIESKNSNYLLWERRPFLTVGPKFEEWGSRYKMVVHGHTPVKWDSRESEIQPVVKEDRVNIDTGAYFTGCLTAYNVTQKQFKQFKNDEATGD